MAGQEIIERRPKEYKDDPNDASYRLQGKNPGESYPKKICAWCHRVISEGGFPATHGICPACVEKEMQRYRGGIGIHEEGSPGKRFI